MSRQDVERPVGTATLLVSKDFRLTYECAAWSKTVAVPRGLTVPVLETSRCLLVRLPATVVQANLCDNPGTWYARDRGPEQVGRIETYNVVLARRSILGGWHAGSYGDLWPDSIQAAHHALHNRGKVTEWLRLEMDTKPAATAAQPEGA